MPACANWPTPNDNHREWVWDDDPMYSWQDRRCGFCGWRCLNERLVRDHDHQTGLIRGYLCAGCNVHEAFSYSAAWQMWRDGCNPASILGIEEIYF